VGKGLSPPGAGERNGGHLTVASLARKARLRTPIVVAVAAWILAALLFPTHQPRDVAAAGFTSDAPLDGAAGDDLTAAGPAVGANGSAAGVPGASAAGTAGGVAAGASTGAVSRGGVTCGPGVHQIPTNTYAGPCVPKFSGNNGGATAPGVTGTTIRIVRRKFPESANSQAVSAVAQQAGAADPAQIRATSRVFIDYFEKMFELYGRHVEWVDYESQYGNSTNEAQGKGREEACLDADVVAKELHAFAVMGEALGAAGGVSKVFAECAAQRGVLVLDGAAYASDAFYKRYHPYIWATAMDCERIVYQVVEYLAKRLGQKPAKFAGDAATRAKSRVYGTYVPTGDDDKTCGDLTQSELKRYGYGDVSGSVYNYTLDVSRFPDEAARGVRQFKSDGVTTVVLACDPISVIFLTQSATNQAWYPEWLLIGVALTDVDNLARLYDQKQVQGHMFGLSQLGATTKLNGPTSEPGRVYQQLTGRPMALGTDGSYFAYTRFYNFLQSAGPILTAANVARGVWTLPKVGAPDYAAGEWYFQDGPNGTPGGHDHSAIEDSREIYWIGNARSPADGKTGTFAETYGGRRFGNGDWPTEDPPIYPAG